MTGAIKYKPYMQISFISFKKKLTLSIAIYGTQSDRAIIEKFFKFFDEEIEAVI